LESWTAGTNASNTAGTALGRGPGDQNWAVHPAASGVQAIDLLGSRYFNLHQCDFFNGSTGAHIISSSAVGEESWTAGTNASNTADTELDCGPGDQNWAVHPAASGVQAIDLLGSRYFNLHQCDFFNGSTGAHIISSSAVGEESWTAGTNASNTTAALQYRENLDCRRP